jgi:hypothetical protein
MQQLYYNDMYINKMENVMNKLIRVFIKLGEVHV